VKARVRQDFALRLSRRSCRNSLNYGGKRTFFVRSVFSALGPKDRNCLVLILFISALEEVSDVA